MLSKAMGVIFLYCSIFHRVNTQSVSVPSNIEARVRTLYTLSNTSMPNQNYTLIFNLSTFTTLPSFGFGVNDFKIRNSLTQLNFECNTINILATSVILQLASYNSSSILRLSISYIAVWDLNSIFIVPNEYANVANISTGSGPRYYKKYQAYNFNSLNVVSLPFIKGFYYTPPSGPFEINITIEIISQANYQVYIQTISECNIKKVSIDILFYYPNILTSLSYSFAGDMTTFSSTSSHTNSNEYSVNIPNYSNTIFILGLAGFYGISTGGSSILGWSVTSTVNNTATIQLNKQGFQKLYNSYFQIGIIQNTPTTNTNAAQTASPEKNNYLPIIAGIIAAICVIATGIVLVIKCYGKSAPYNIPQKDNFRILPALSF